MANRRRCHSAIDKETIVSKIKFKLSGKLAELVQARAVSRLNITDAHECTPFRLEGHTREPPIDSCHHSRRDLWQRRSSILYFVATPTKFPEPPTTSVFTVPPVYAFAWTFQPTVPVKSTPMLSRPKTFPEITPD